MPMSYIHFNQTEIGLTLVKASAGPVVSIDGTNSCCDVDLNDYPSDPSDNE